MKTAFESIVIAIRPIFHLTDRLESGHGVGALPERTVSRRQQAGGYFAESRALGRSQGVDERRTAVTVETHV